MQVTDESDNLKEILQALQLPTPFEHKLAKLYAYLADTESAAWEAFTSEAVPGNADDQYFSKTDDDTNRDAFIEQAKQALRLDISNRPLENAVQAAARTVGYTHIGPNDDTGIVIEDVDITNPTWADMLVELKTPPSSAPMRVLAAPFSRAAWRAYLRQDAAIEKAIASLAFSHQEYNPVTLLTQLLAIDLSKMVPISRCFVLWSLYEILNDLPPNPELTAMLTQKVDVYGCRDIFAAAPDGSAPSRSQVIARLLAL